MDKDDLEVLLLLLVEVDEQLLPDVRLEDEEFDVVEEDDGDLNFRWCLLSDFGLPLCDFCFAVDEL